MAQKGPEGELLSNVLECAAIFGWRRAHFRPSLTKYGWRTAVQGDGAGFPDLILLRRGRLVVAELKSDRGRVSPEQALWLAAFDELATRAAIYADTGGPGPIVVVTWRPRDWLSGEIEEVLR